MAKRIPSGKICHFDIFRCQINDIMTLLLKNDVTRWRSFNYQKLYYFIDFRNNSILGLHELIIMKPMYNNKTYNPILYISLLMLVCIACTSKGELKDFDSKKLKEAYELDMMYTNKRFNEQKKKGLTFERLSNLTMITTFLIKGKITFDPNDKTLFTSLNKFNQANKSYHFFDYKIENKSIISIKNESDDTFIKSAILL